MYRRVQCPSGAQTHASLTPFIATQSLSVRQTFKHDAPVAMVKWMPGTSNLYRRVRLHFLYPNGAS